MSDVRRFLRLPALSASLLPVSFLATCPMAQAAATATATTMTITSGAATVASVATGTAVTLTATVKAGKNVVPAGTVNFCDAKAAHCTDIHVLGTAMLSTAGTATLKIVPGPGAHSYKAEFVGTVTDAASTSSVASLTVDATPTTTTIAATGTVGDYTLKATILGKGSTTGPTGKVSFLDTSASNAVLGTATLGAPTRSLNWTTPTAPATSPEPQSIVVADFNGDGIPDIAIGTNGTTATRSTGYLNIFIGNGDGTFQPARKTAALPNNGAMVAAHFVTGGPLDLITVDNNPTGVNNAALFLGDGKGGGTMHAPFSLGGMSNVTAIAAGDFNRDGNEDFVITGLIYGIYCFAPILGTGKGTFGGPTLNAVGNDPLLVAVGAFSTSGYQDIVVTDTGVEQVTIFQNNGQGHFVPAGQANTGANPTAMVTGDFNGDGYLDLAVTNGGSDNVTILLGKGNETLTFGPQAPEVGHNPTSIAVGDFNGDGIPDLAVANSGSNSVTVLLGKGNGTFIVEPDLNTGVTPLALAVGAFNSSSATDIAVANEDAAATTGSTATILLAQLIDSATATVSGIAPTGASTHLVEASYAGDATYHASTSGTTSLHGTAQQTAAPIVTPAAGTYSTAQTVTLTDRTSAATIYYTTNGTTPTTASTRYSAPFKVATTTTVEAIATAPGDSQSIVAMAKYVIEPTAATPVFSKAAGEYTAAQTVAITDTTPGAVLYYTTNGTTPTTASTKYTTAITVSASETIRALAVASGHNNSAIASAAYVIKTSASMPSVSKAASTYTVPLSVELNDASSGAESH